MQALQIVEKLDLIPKEYKGHRVVTFKDIDRVHERKDGTAKTNFTRNRQHFSEGVDYFKVPKKELSGFLPPNPTSGNPNLPITLLTQTGYLMIVKTFTDKKSWSIQRILVDGYFNQQAAPTAIEPQALPDELNPQLQMFKALFDNAVTQDARLREVEDKMSQMQKRIDLVPTFELPETTEPFDGLFLAPVTLYTTTDIAKCFNISARAVNRYLLSQDIHSPYKRGWKLHARYDECNYTYNKIGYFTAGGERLETYMTYWTATGKDFLCTVLKNAGLKQKGKPKAYDRHLNRGKRKRN